LGGASATWDDGNQSFRPDCDARDVGTFGGLITTFSALHDLAITPSAASQGKPLSVGLGVRSDGLLAVRVRF
jgi:hypothetical protein